MLLAHQGLHHRLTRWQVLKDGDCFVDELEPRLGPFTFCAEEGGATEDLGSQRGFGVRELSCGSVAHGQRAVELQ